MKKKPSPRCAELEKDNKVLWEMMGYVFQTSATDRLLAESKLDVTLNTKITQLRNRDRLSWTQLAERFLSEFGGDIPTAKDAIRIRYRRHMKVMRKVRNILLTRLDDAITFHKKMKKRAPHLVKEINCDLRKILHEITSFLNYMGLSWKQFLAWS
jgi:hypothetical protein